MFILVFERESVFRLVVLNENKCFSLERRQLVPFSLCTSPSSSSLSFQISLGGNRTSFLCDCTHPSPLQRWIRRNRKKVSAIRKRIEQRKSARKTWEISFSSQCELRWKSSEEVIVVVSNSSKMNYLPLIEKKFMFLSSHSLFPFH